MNATQPLDAATLAREAAAAAWDKKARDVVALHVGPVVGYTDYFVICSATNRIHLQAIADNIEEALHKRCGVKPHGEEGRRGAQWILIDYVDVVVHIFDPSAREYYALDRLWADAEPLALEEPDWVREEIA